jgi:hypothetical protein
VSEVPAPSAPRAPATLVEALADSFTPRPAREALRALERVRLELFESLKPALDHNVAHVRLAWWKEEIARLAAGAPLHPETRALYALGGATPRYDRLLDCVTAIEFQLAGHTPETADGFEALCLRTHGAPAALAAELLCDATDAASFGMAVGTAEGLIEAIESGAPVTWLKPRIEQRLSHDAPAGRALAPLKVRRALARARLTPAGIEATPSPFKALFLAWRAARA